MKGKRARHLLTYLLYACLLVSLLSGCGSNDSDNDGRGDIVEDQTPATVETVNAEDFYGCWKYTDLEDWVYIYGDGTYEWFEEDGSSEVGTYQMDGGELVMDDGLRYTLDGDGRLIDEPRDTLSPTEPRRFTPVAYFEERGYSFDLEMDIGRLPLENAVRYYYTDGSYYTTTYGEWALSMISDDVVNDQYREVTFRASCYFTNSSAPAQSNQYYAGCSPEIFDYYTGEWLPISNTLGDASEDENTCSYALNIDGEEVRLDYMMSVYWEKDVGDCARIAHHTYTVRMPADYDGLVFCASPSPYNFEEFQTFQHEREGYVTGVTLEKCTGIDEDNALFCRIR